MNFSPSLLGEKRVNIMAFFRRPTVKHLNIKKIQRQVGTLFLSNTFTAGFS